MQQPASLCVSSCLWKLQSKITKIFPSYTLCKLQVTPLERTDVGYQLNKAKAKGEEEKGETSVNTALGKLWQKRTVVADAGGQQMYEKSVV